MTSLPPTPDPLCPFDCFYDATRKSYVVKDYDGNWIDQTEVSLKRRLKAAGISTKYDAGNMSGLDRSLIHIQDHYSVIYTGPLAGYARGIHYDNGKKILVTEELELMAPFKRPWPIFQQVLDGSLLGDDGIDQRPYYIGWAKHAYTALISHSQFPGQALVMAGEAGSCKSLHQALLTAMLGGESAKPYRYMMGQSHFNRDLFRACHLMIEDEAASTDLRTRRQFGAKIKEITVNEVQSCHGKIREAISLRPIWRISISLNDQAHNLMILPPMDPSLLDKFIILKAHKRPLPMPTGTMQERSAFWLKLMEELPGFIHYFMYEWEMPKELRSERFGVTHFHHPELMKAFRELAPEIRLLGLIDTIILGTDCVEWTGTSEALERLITENRFYNYAARILFTWNGACGSLLADLASQFPARVQKISRNPVNKWKLIRDAAFVDAPPELPTHDLTAPIEVTM